ncbi:MAG: hypothetical protein JST22_07160 [Bacteroidetes bacterium]|nr:hypothetical protein [Bacteroidota bacterium]
MHRPSLLQTAAGACILCALLFLAQCLYAGNPIVQPKGKGELTIYGGSSSTTGYYDVNGVMKRFDTLATEFTATTFGMNMTYGLTDDVQLDLDVPLGYYSITSKALHPKRSIFSITYYGVGATYQLSRGKVSSSISGMVKVPPGFHHGIYDDPNHPTFLSDGYFQIGGAFNFGFNMKETWIKGHVGYNWRDEEPADEIVYGAEVGFSKVEGTGIYVKVDGVVTTADVTQPLEPFYAGTSGPPSSLERLDGGRGIFRTIDREDYTALTAGAFVGISSHVFLSGSYTLRLFGNNTLDLKGAYLGAGYKF